MRKLVFCTLALLAAACSPPASNTAASGGTESGAQPQTTAAATPGPGGLRPGRWNKTITVMGQQTHEVECVTDSDINRMAREPNSNCTSPNGFQRTAEGLVYEATCTGEDGGGSLRTVLTGDMQNNYTAVMTTSGGGVNMQIRIDGAYEGACHGDE